MSEPVPTATATPATTTPATAPAPVGAAPAAGAGGGDALDKGINSILGKFGHAQSGKNTEKISDGIRG